jgi:protocatechuate 3,4-dioxygenase beta subunit
MGNRNEESNVNISRDRRRLLSWVGASALAPLLSTPALADDLPSTPRMTEGPFYPRTFPKDMDGDLTRVEGRAKAADGTPLDLTGRVLDRTGKPRAGAKVEVWQCDALGQYHHVGAAQSDGDPNFQGYGVVETDAEGRYRF